MAIRRSIALNTESSISAGRVVRPASSLTISCSRRARSAPKGSPFIATQSSHHRVNVWVALPSRRVSLHYAFALRSAVAVDIALDAMNDERSAEVADRSIMEKLRKLPR
jgi:hypothetical protein